MIAKSGADYGLSIHLNSATNPTACGGEIYVPCRESYGLIEYHMAKELGKLNKFRGVKSRELNYSQEHPTYTREISSNGAISDVRNVSDYYGVIRESWGKVSTTIVELVFISNKDDMTIFINQMDKYVEVIVKSICEGFKVPYSEPKKETSSSTSKKMMYRVSVGSYENKANAEKMRQELVEKGYTDTFISVVEV